MKNKKNSSNNTKNDTQKDYVIYVMIDAKFHKFYVGTTTKNRISSAMCDHFDRKIRGTKELFSPDLSPATQPNMFFLSSIYCNKKTAESKMIPYIKFFLEQKMQCLNTEKMISFTQDLHEENQELYAYIKQYSLEELCNQDTNLFPNYVEKRKKREQSTPSAINTKVTEEEYNRIKKLAEKNQMPIHKYAKQSILYDGKIVQVNFDALHEAITEQKNLNITLKQILYTIQKTETYYSEDLVILQNIVDESEKLCKEMMKTTGAILQDLNKIVNV